MKVYDIGGRNYVQKPLKLVQTAQLLEVLQGVTFLPVLGIAGIVQALGPRVADVVAIALVPEGVALKDKDLVAEREYLEENMDNEQLIEVLADFLLYNPVSSYLEKLTGIVDQLSASIVGLKTSSAGSPTAT